MTATDLQVLQPSTTRKSPSSIGYMCTFKGVRAITSVSVLHYLALPLLFGWQISLLLFQSPPNYWQTLGLVFLYLCRLGRVHSCQTTAGLHEQYRCGTGPWRPLPFLFLVSASGSTLPTHKDAVKQVIYDGCLKMLTAAACSEINRIPFFISALLGSR